MPGIYIHIPFCRQACFYCNFHFSASKKNKPDFLSALKNEIELSKDFFKEKTTSSEKIYLDTIYFGGGTPSILSNTELMEIFNVLSRFYTFDDNTEITLEANPDDLSKTRTKELFQSPVNRLSIGVQSFHEADLNFMNRSHNKDQALQSIINSKQAGFKNITVDLIYGTPGMTHKQWIENLNILHSLNIPHISAYALTVENNTALNVFINKGKLPNISEEDSAQQFEILQKWMQENNYRHYEISNFGKDGFFSKHNISYWTGKKYLGLGPSAHSFNGEKRFWNISNTHSYIDSLKNGIISRETEVLTKSQKINEYIMTSLRTMWGCDLNKISSEFGNDIQEQIINSSRKFINKGWMQKSNQQLILTKTGKLFADGIAAELFFD
ncbi:MAG: radical SAM family heme chaperone HemW [Bacteroidota bacterium]